MDEYEWVYRVGLGAEHEKAKGMTTGELITWSGPTFGLPPDAALPCTYSTHRSRGHLTRSSKTIKPKAKHRNELCLYVPKALSEAGLA